MENSNNIPVSAIKGFCTLPVCWLYLHDIATELVTIHGKGMAHGNISVTATALSDNRFTLCNGGTGTTAESDIWQLAASAMELMLGSPIMNGKGERGMRADTPIPMLPNKDADALNRLLSRCLAFEKEKRPKAIEVAECAKKEMERIAQAQREQKPRQAMTRKDTLEKFERQWPEAIKANITRIIAFLAVATIGCTSLQAQTVEMNGEEMLTTMRDAVLLLRNNDEASWERAQDEFQKHLNSVTLMDELQDRTNDCLPIAGKVKKRGVNRLITELKNGRRVQNSERELLDGSDSRFNYSIFEKCIKQGATSTYTMKGRSGKQVYLVIPYKTDNRYSCKLIMEGERVFEPSLADENGISYFFIESDNGPQENETVTLKISNGEKNGNASFVIINHNYRDK